MVWSGGRVATRKPGLDMDARRGPLRRSEHIHRLVRSPWATLGTNESLSTWFCAYPWVGLVGRWQLVNQCVISWLGRRWQLVNQCVISWLGRRWQLVNQCVITLFGRRWQPVNQCVTIQCPYV